MSTYSPPPAPDVTPTPNPTPPASTPFLRRRWVQLVGVGVASFILGAVAAGSSASNGTTTGAAPAPSAVTVTSTTTADASAAAASSSAPAATSEAAGYTPKPADFHLTLKILKKECFGSAGCNVEYRVTVDYKGQPVADGTTYEVTYNVTGGQDGTVTNTFTADNATISVESSEMIQTASSSTKLRVKATSVSKA